MLGCCHGLSYRWSPFPNLALPACALAALLSCEIPAWLPVEALGVHPNWQEPRNPLRHHPIFSILSPLFWLVAEVNDFKVLLVTPSASALAEELGGLKETPLATGEHFPCPCGDTPGCDSQPGTGVQVLCGVPTCAAVFPAQTGNANWWGCKQLCHHWKPRRRSHFSHFSSSSVPLVFPIPPLFLPCLQVPCKIFI